MTLSKAMFWFQDYNANNIGRGPLDYEYIPNNKDLGPVVQSVVSLTSSLKVISLTVLADSIYNILIFYSHFFSRKIQHICVSLDVNFKESLTNDVVSFEQLGSGRLLVSDKKSFKVFHDMSLCKASDLWAIVWTILIKVHKMKLNTKYQRHRHSSFRQEDV